AGGAGSLLDVAYGNGLFAANGAGGVYTSPDAVTWAHQLTNTHSEGISFANGIFLLVGDLGDFFTSPDGTNWTHQTVGLSSDRFYTATYGNGAFATAGYPGTYIRTSTDAVNWANQLSGFGGSISALVFANGTFVGAADLG